MKIYTFGCSFTYGLKYANHNVTSWVEKLVERYPEIEFEDYSFPGTDLNYSLYLFEKIMPCVLPEDKVIFQFTIPFRYTTWEDSSMFDNEDYRYKKLPNYTKFSAIMKDDLETYQSSRYQQIDTMKLPENLDRQFFESYYRKINLDKELSSFNSNVKYVAGKSNFTFFHASPVVDVQDDNGNTITSIAGILGKDFKKYIWDHGQHYNDEGCNFIADIIQERIGLVNI